MLFLVEPQPRRADQRPANLAHAEEVFVAEGVMGCQLSIPDIIADIGESRGTYDRWWCRVAFYVLWPVAQLTFFVEPHAVVADERVRSSSDALEVSVAVVVILDKVVIGDALAHGKRIWCWR